MQTRSWQPFSAIRNNFVPTGSLFLCAAHVSLIPGVLMWGPFLQLSYLPSSVFQRHPTPWCPFAFLPLLSVIRQTHFLLRNPRVSRITTYSPCPTGQALQPQGSEFRLAALAPVHVDCLSFKGFILPNCTFGDQSFQPYSLLPVDRCPTLNLRGHPPHPKESLLSEWIALPRQGRGGNSKDNVSFLVYQW